MSDEWLKEKVIKCRCFSKMKAITHYKVTGTIRDTEYRKQEEQ